MDKNKFTCDYCDYKTTSKSNIKCHIKQGIVLNYCVLIQTRYCINSFVNKIGYNFHWKLTTSYWVLSIYRGVIHFGLWLLQFPVTKEESDDDMTVAFKLKSIVWRKLFVWDLVKRVQSNRNSIAKTHFVFLNFLQNVIDRIYQMQ